jgi:hypothetical protein
MNLFFMILALSKPLPFIELLIVIQLVLLSCEISTLGGNHCQETDAGQLGHICQPPL